MTENQITRRGFLAGAAATALSAIAGVPVLAEPAPRLTALPAPPPRKKPVEMESWELTHTYPVREVAGEDCWPGEIIREDIDLKVTLSADAGVFDRVLEDVCGRIGEYGQVSIEREFQKITLPMCRLKSLRFHLPTEQPDKTWRGTVDLSFYALQCDSGIAPEFGEMRLIEERCPVLLPEHGGGG